MFERYGAKASLTCVGLTRIERSLLCGLIAVLPFVWQAHVQRQLGRNQGALDTQLLATERIADELDQDLSRRRDSLLRAKAEREKAELELTRERARIANREVGPVYRWDDASPIMRVPKSSLNQASVGAAVNRRGELSDQIKEILQLNELETQQTQAALHRFLDLYYEIQGQNMRLVVPKAEELDGHTAEQTRVFEISGLGERFNQLRDSLLSELETVLGPDRLPLFAQALDGWMPMSDERKAGPNMAVLEFGRRERFYEPTPGSRQIQWGFIKMDHSAAVAASMTLDDIPAVYRPYLNDWIVSAQTQPANPGDSQVERRPQ